MAITNQLGIRNSNTIIPLTSSTKRTKEIALTFSSAPTGWATVRAVGIFYADSNGVWRLKFNIEGTLDSANTGALVVAGVTFYTTGNIRQVCSVNAAGGAPTANYSYTDYSNNGIFWNVTNNVTTIILYGDVELASEPTWASLGTTAAAAMEGVVAVDVYIAPASATSAGLLNYYQEDDTTLAAATFNWDGTRKTNAFVGRVTRVGRVVTLSWGTALGTALAQTTATSSVNLPTWAKPSADVSVQIMVYSSSAQAYPGYMFINPSTGAISIYYTIAQANWPAAATTGVLSGMITYNI